MKNLNKKIGAVALAGMVVLGGFAASGAQSFAFSGDYGQLELALEGKAYISEEMEKDMKKLKAKINGLGYNYDVIIAYHNADMLKSDAQGRYSDFNSQLQRQINLDSRIGERMLKYRLSNKPYVSIVKFEGQYYFIKQS